MADETATFALDYETLGLWLRTSPELRAYLEDLGRRGVEYARSIAPVGVRATKNSTPGQYRDSLTYQIAVSGQRMFLRIHSMDYTAWWVEYGSKRVPRYAVLRRTLDYLSTGAGRSASEYAGAAEYHARKAATRRQRLVSQARRIRASRR